MVYTPEEEEKWAEGEIKVIDGKRYKVSYEVLPTGDVQMLLEEIEKIIGHDKMAELLDVPKELYASVIDESAHDCFLIEKRELLSEEEEERVMATDGDIGKAWKEIEKMLSEGDKEMLAKMEKHSRIRGDLGIAMMVRDALALLYLNSQNPIDVDFGELFAVSYATIIAPKRYADWFKKRFKNLLEAETQIFLNVKSLEEEEHEKEES